MLSSRVLARLAAFGLTAAALVLVGHIDGVASSVACAGGVAVWILLRHPSPARPRRAAAGLVIAATAAALVAALALPVYRDATPRLIMLRGPHTSSGPPASQAAVPSGDAHPFESLGFVASDNEDSPPGVDRDASKLTSLAVTGTVLSGHPGRIEVTPATDALLRGHASGAAGLAVVSNYDGAGFNARRAAAMLRSPPARHRFVSAVTGEVARQGWDGVLLDFENLPPSVRAVYPALVHDLDLALGRRRIDIAVPATTSVGIPEFRAYDLPALARNADHIVWMAYDQHDPTGSPGPVAGMPWVRQGLGVAEQLVPRHKLLLGLAGYGYSWTGVGRGTDLTFEQAQALRRAPGAAAHWDDVQQEWYARAAGRDVWYEDAASLEARARLAAADGLAGVALWRVGSEEPGSLDRFPPSQREPGLRVGRAVERVPASGLVALTFDDGPDPTWTPRVLAVLRREHVPGTFFVIGNRAQSHPELVRAEIRDGYVVGNHTYSHPNLNKASALRTRVEILGGEAVIEGITGRRPLLFRSPYGAGDMSSTRLGSDQLAADLGLHNVSWNDDSFDWQGPGVAAITRTVVDGASSRAVVLLHDGGGNRSQTLAALPAIIHGLRARGYVFTTADALDGAVASPYAARHGMASKARGAAVVASYRLFVAFRHVIVWLVLIAVGLSLLRLVLTALLALWHWRRHSVGLISLDTPSVSVVIPARNEARVIGKTLGALLALEDAPDELLVVDDGSSDATAEIAERLGVTVLRQAPAGKATALNRGIRHAFGEIVVVLDADTVVEPGFLRAVVAHFADPSVGAVAGNVKVGNRRRLLAHLQAVEYIVSLNLDRRAQAAAGVVAVVPGAAGAFRRRALIDVGGYPTDTLVEDMDLTVTLLRAGWQIPYEPRAQARTEAPEQVREVLRQRRRWAFGTLQVVAKHSDCILDPGAKRVGLVGLPWMVLSQVVLPLLGPVIDAYLVYLALVGQWTTVAYILGIGIALDVAVVALATLIDGEDLRYIALTPLMRILWRPLQLVAVFVSVNRWVHGSTETWRKVRRYNTVPVAILSGSHAA